MENIVDLSLGILHPDLDLGLPTDNATKMSRAYAPKKGLHLLRKAIAEIEGVELDNVIITLGASMALTSVIALLDSSKCFLIPCPYFPAYVNTAQLLRKNYITYDLENIKNPVKSIKQALKSLDFVPSAIVINTPGNPMGNVFNVGEVIALKSLAAEIGTLLIIDEAYQGMSFGKSDNTWRGFGVADGLLRIRSFSKSHRLAGARIGYAVGPVDLLSRMSDVHWTLAMSVSIGAQMEAATALMSTNINAEIALSQKLTDLYNRAVSFLEHPNIEIVKPAAGPFLWLRFPYTSLDSTTLAGLCASEVGVGVSPGAAYGVQTPTCLRITFALPEHLLDSVFLKVGNLLKKYSGYNVECHYE